MADQIFLRYLNSHEVGEQAPKSILLLPIGQTEEHGQHLPIGCDAIIAETVSEAVARRCLGKLPVLVAPAIQYGYSNEIMRQWPGTFIVRAQTMIDLITDVCCSAVKMGFKKIAIVSAHGHHVGIIRVAIRQVFDQVGVNVVMTTPHGFTNEILPKIRKSAPGGVCHACEYETSLLLHFGCPVDMSRASNVDRLRFKLKYVATDGIGGNKAGSVFWSTWGLQQSKTGTLGDPSVATAETGRLCMEAIVDHYCQFLQEFHAWSGPVLPADEE